MIKAVIFDLDGLMIDSEPLSWKAWNRMLEPYGGQLSYPDFRALIGLEPRASAEIVRAQAGIQADISEIIADHDRLRTEIVALEAKPMPGCLELVEELLRRDLAIGVASNSPSAHVRAALRAIELTDRIPQIVGVDQVSKGKPAPDLYLLAAEKLEMEPENCLVLEDTPTGLEAARAADMRCVVVPNRDIPGDNFEGAFGRFASLEEVHSQLDRLLG